ncbi:hypothetical protein LCGC14_2331800 [marine sediment metagenome]|uniref:Uncharacterized protein n=1 Tax=marine sediment metagenome TaxID=412755 RepID=A0A0F9ESD4_9ZZZZ
MMTKVCRCYPATASGPRLIYRSRSRLGHPVLFTVFTFVLVHMACDVCDTAWEVGE